AEIEKGKKAQEEINQRTDKELEEFRATLKNLALPEEAIKKITEAIKLGTIGQSISKSLTGGVFERINTFKNTTSQTFRD
ncbi:peptidase, partial [Streptococcus pyogenes]